MKRSIALILAAVALLAGCAGPAPQSTQAPQKPSSAQSEAMVNVTVNDLQERLKSDKPPLVIDVREPDEYAAGHIEGARLMPLGKVETEILPIPKDEEIYLVCRSGNRSAQAYRKLAALGYTNLKNVTGGMLQWEKVGPVVK